MFKHSDRIPPIRAIEERDIRPLVDEGRAQLLRGTSRDQARFHVRVYEILLRTNWEPICLAVHIRFVYDYRIGRAAFILNDLHAYLLYMAFNGRTPSAEQRAITRIIYGSDPEPWRIPLK